MTLPPLFSPDIPRHDHRFVRFSLAKKPRLALVVDRNGRASNASPLTREEVARVVFCSAEKKTHAIQEALAAYRLSPSDPTSPC
jgi:hypothetical protein